MIEAHRTAHSLIPSEIIEVSESDVVRFLGKVQDPVDASEVSSPFRTVCFTDLVGSTELLDRLGQSDYIELLTEHDRLIRKTLIRSNRREVKHTGDGFLVVFDWTGLSHGHSMSVTRSRNARSRYSFGDSGG